MYKGYIFTEGEAPKYIEWKYPSSNLADYGKHSSFMYFLDFNYWAIKDGIVWKYIDEPHVPAEYRALTLLL